MYTTGKLNFSEQETEEKSSEIISGKSLENLKLLEAEEGIRMNTKEMFELFFLTRLKNWTYSSLKDEYRPDYANKSSGGIDYTDKKLISMMRSTGYDIIKQIGKKIITGDFNLTTVSFPIKVMLPMSILQSIAKSVFQFPIYLNMAASQIDPLEKFKLVIVATISCFHANSEVLKPLNPILGETHESVYEDGTRIYLEQTAHHPPITNYIMYGPGGNFKVNGFSHFTSSAGLNSLKLYNKGKRFFEFKDGSRIATTFCNEIYSNTFWGTTRHESLGEITFKDLTYGFECVLKLGGVKKKPSDYFSGEIKMKNISVSKVYGSYLSFVEFNSIRYWDIRENIPIKRKDFSSKLKSDSIRREDRILLDLGKIDEAQAAKEKLEEIQRADRKLREKYQKLHK